MCGGVDRAKLESLRCVWLFRVDILVHCTRGSFLNSCGKDFSVIYFSQKLAVFRARAAIGPTLEKNLKPVLVCV